jgi:ADP-ribose pyrophosphatase YjhB (NUDIX family)
MKPPPQGDMVRNSAKAVIVKEGKILLIKRFSDGETWYTLPGGGQNKFETLESALKREVREETGQEIRFGDLMFVGEYIGRNHEFAKDDSDIHQVDLHFLCESAGEPGEITTPDSNQTGIEWVETGKLAETNLYPKYLRKKIPDYLSGMRDNVYMGDTN